MHGEEVDLESRLEAALVTYETRSGRRLSWDEVDPRLHPSAYGRFSNASHRPAIAPDRGEWIDFEMGRKPILRLVLDQPAWNQVRSDCSAQGYVTTSLPRPVEESSLGPVTATNQPHPRVVAFVGRDLRLVAEAAEVDEHLLSRIRSPNEWRTLGRRLGTLLGYPPCCVEHFVGLDPKADNRAVVQAVARNTTRFDPLLNNLSLSVYHAISWYPCRYDCEPSLKIAREIDRHVRANSPAARAKLDRILAMPRLYLDDRRQLIFDGTLDEGGRFHFQAVHSPFTFDRHPGNTFVDWVFHVDVVERVLKARWAEPTDTGLRLGRGEKPLGEIELGGVPVSLPFQRTPDAP